MNPRLTHLDDNGSASMVDVTGKAVTARQAVARCLVRCSHERRDAPTDVARIAGIRAAKLCASLIPLCHSVLLDDVDVDVTPCEEGYEIRAVAEITERTGVEMEALTACSFAALTLVASLVDSDDDVSIDDLTVWRKSGGRTGTWQRESMHSMRHESAP